MQTKDCFYPIHSGYSYSDTVLYIQKETGLIAQTLPPGPFCKKEKFIIGEFEHFRLALGRDDVSELIGKNV